MMSHNEEFHNLYSSSSWYYSEVEDIFWGHIPCVGKIRDGDNTVLEIF
jgi:hypothetical protein